MDTSKTNNHIFSLGRPKADKNAPDEQGKAKAKTRHRIEDILDKRKFNALYGSTY